MTHFKIKKIAGAWLIICFTAAFPINAQFTAEEILEFSRWEEFLQTADLVASQQMRSREAVTKPWILTLEKEGVKRKAIWKDAAGFMNGSIEGWDWEIAAYRLCNYLGIYMVPPTVERVFQGKKGSCQLWIEDVISVKDKYERNIKTPSYKRFSWNRALYLQRAFDNLIANEDRHQKQFLITADWRIILIDHSRSFRTSNKFTRNLLYDEHHREGPRIMRELPRSFVEKLKSLDEEIIRSATGTYLNNKEIEAVLKRRDLIISWIQQRINEVGEENVLY